MWASDTILLPDVSTNINYSDGITQTYNIVKNCYELNITSPMCEYALKQTYTHNNINYLPFVGSVVQYNEIIGDNYETIVNSLSLFGLSVIIRNKPFYSSTQVNANYAYFWYWNNWSDWLYNKKSYRSIITLFTY